MPQPPGEPVNPKQVRLPQRPAQARQPGNPTLPAKRVVSERSNWERGPEGAPTDPGNYVDPARQRMPYNPVPQPAQTQGGGAAWGQVGLGALMAGGGTVGTFASYSAASPGGKYTVFYGLIVVGIITLIKGIASLAR